MLYNHYLAIVDSIVKSRLCEARTHTAVLLIKNDTIFCNQADHSKKSSKIL